MYTFVYPETGKLTHARLMSLANDAAINEGLDTPTSACEAIDILEDIGTFAFTLDAHQTAEERDYEGMYESKQAQSEE